MTTGEKGWNNAACRPPATDRRPQRTSAHISENQSSLRRARTKTLNRRACAVFAGRKASMHLRVCACVRLCACALHVCVLVCVCVCGGAR